MKKVGREILSLPPYISTSWKNVEALHLKKVEDEQILVVVLRDGTAVDVPGLQHDEMMQIFKAHAQYTTEQESVDQKPTRTGVKLGPNGDSAVSFSLPFEGRNLVDGIENMGAFMQHNVKQSHAPDLPAHIIDRIVGITKACGVDVSKMEIPPPEPHCNCPYCQIARAIKGGSREKDKEASIEDQAVSEEDLRFRDWDIRQKGDKLYEVSNPLDTEESYQVFLGHPVGCTCGQKHCEHIRSVLSS